MNWLQPLWDFLQIFNPFFMVPQYNWAIRFTNGKAADKPLRTGVNIRIPFLQEIHDVASIPEVWQFDTQTIGTADGRVVTIAANVEILVTDPVALLTKIYKWNDSLRGEITGHLTERINSMSYDETMLNGGLKKLQDSLTGRLTTKIKDWGLKIERVSFNEFCPSSQQIRIYSDQPVKL